MRSFVWSILLLVGCGGTAPHAADPETPAHADTAPVTSSAGPETAAPAAAKAGPATAEDDATVPKSCADAGHSPCVMKPGFVKRLCSKANPDLAIALFARDTPWLRVYVNVKQADSFNGLGGPSSQEKLFFDEELLVLAERKNDMGGMSVSGAGASYDMLRWDGTCATLTVAELTERKPPKAKHARIPWRSLSDGVQKALLKDEKAAGYDATRRKECKGVEIGAVSAACEKAVHALNDRIADSVRGGLTVPLPATLQ